MPIAAAAATYKSEIGTHLGFISRAYTLDANSKYLLNDRERSFIVDSAFLRMFIAWESYLEQTFILYMLGNASSTGKTATRFATPTTADHANEMLIGTQRYVDWSNPEIVRKLANLYFKNGEPITGVVSAITTTLFDLKTIRNAAAHMSSTTSKSLDALASRRLQSVQVGIRVSDFITATDPTSNPGVSILDSYINALDISVDHLTNW